MFTDYLHKDMVTASLQADSTLLNNIKRNDNPYLFLRTAIIDSNPFIHISIKELKKFSVSIDSFSSIRHFIAAQQGETRQYDHVIVEPINDGDHWSDFISLIRLIRAENKDTVITLFTHVRDKVLLQFWLSLDNVNILSKYERVPILGSIRDHFMQTNCIEICHYIDFLLMGYSRPSRLSDNDLQQIQYLIETGSQSNAAKMAGVSPQVFSYHLKLLIKKLDFSSADFSTLINRLRES